MANREFDEENEQVSPVEIQRHLARVDYPCTKDELLEHARQDNAPEDVLWALEQIDDREYDSPTDVSEAIGDLE